jgi:hypothetical protein
MAGAVGGLRRKASVTALAVALLGSFALVPRADAVVLPGTNGLIIVENGGTLISLDPATGTRQTLLASQAGDGGAHVSPNGTKVAFLNPFSAIAPTASVFIADFPSGANRQQVTTTNDSGSVNWAPDSATLVFDCSSGLCTAPAVANATKTILNQTTAGANTFATKDINPDFSPNGAFIYFTDGFPAQTGIFRVNAPTGGGRTKLLNSGANDSRPQTSPDGNTVFFDVPVGAPQGIFSLPFPNGGSRTQLTGTGAGDLRVGPSPDGTKVSFNKLAGIFTVNANGTGGLASVPGSQAGDQRPSWQRAGGGGGGGGTNPNAPVFSAASGCGSTVMVRLLGANPPVALSASDADAGQNVIISASGALPAYLTFSGGTAANPSTAQITANPAGDIIGFILGIFGPASNVALNATDNGTPSKTTPCNISFRPGLF